MSINVPVVLLNAIFFLFILNHKLVAQEETSGYTFTGGAAFFKGFLIAHSDYARYLTTANPDGFQLFAEKNTFGAKYWESIFNYPSYGVSLFYFNTHQPELGDLVAGTIYMKFYLIRKKYLALTWGLGTGLTYSTNRYDHEENNLNVMMSSIFVFNMQGRLGLEVKLGERLRLQPALTFTHGSNGSWTLPNNGFNVMAANLGASYLISDHTPSFQRPPAPEIDRKVHYNLLVSGARHERRPIGSGGFPYLTFRAYADKPLSRINRLTAGTEIFLNYSLKAEIAGSPLISGNKKADYKKAGVFLGHELKAGKVILVSQLGKYIYRPYKFSPERPFYQRYGLKYLPGKRMFFTVLLKTHRGIADTLDLGIGCRL